MALSREEIFSKISEMGRSAGENLEKNAVAFYQLLIILNGSGLIATLAFMGTVLSTNLKLQFIPFYWSSIAFTIGIVSCLMIIFCNFYYFYIAVKKYEKHWLQENPVHFNDTNNLLNLLIILGNTNCKQNISTKVKIISLYVAVISFVLGIILGFISLYKIRIVLNLAI